MQKKEGKVETRVGVWGRREAMCGTWRPDVRAVLRIGRWVALWDCTEGQNRIWGTDRLSRQTVGCFPGGRHIWKNWDLACSWLQSWPSLFFWDKRKPFVAFVLYKALFSSAESKEGWKGGMFPADMTTPARLPLVSILLTWPTHHLAPGTSTNQAHQGISAYPMCRSLIFYTSFLQSNLQSLQLLLHGQGFGLSTVMISQV